MPAIGGVTVSLQDFQCEICGIVGNKPVHWFVIQCSNSQLTVLKWETEAANARGARHYCGEAHAQVYISRWLEAACTPPKTERRSLACFGTGLRESSATLRLRLPL